MADPFSVPSLRDQLKLTHFPSETMIRDTITLFGRSRFRYVDLSGVEGSQLFLEACADTLQMARIGTTILNGTPDPVFTPTDSN